MYIVNLLVDGGTDWDPYSTSRVYPGRNKTGLEHLIIEQCVTLDTGIELVSYLRSLPIEISEDKNGANVAFHLNVGEDENLKNNVLNFIEGYLDKFSKDFKTCLNVEKK